MRFQYPSLISLIVSSSIQGQFVPAPNPSHKVSGLSDLDFSQIKILLQPPPPAYPLEAKAQGIQGTVVVEIIVDTKGFPESAKALEGPIELRATAELYAMGWRFEPARLNGVPSRCRFRLTMPFRLRDLPKAHVGSAVIELRARTQDGENLLPSIRTALYEGLRRLGVVVVVAEGADPAKVHHLRMEVGKAPFGSNRLSLSLRCSLLKDVSLLNNEPGKPISVWSKIRFTPEGVDPLQNIKDQVLSLLLDVIYVPEITPKTLPSDK